MSLISFEDAMTKSRQGDRTILLGNGFSIAQNGTRFTYKSLLEKSGLPQDSPVRKVFHALNTFDFEAVMRALERAGQIELAYGLRERSTILQTDANGVRDALIRAVHAVHPGIQFDLPEAQRSACGDFLKSFQSVFTMNYDLLLYWVIVKSHTHADGFGYRDEINGFRQFDPLGYCTLYYLHGALHLFLDEYRETQKIILRGDTIIGDITETIMGGRLPLFVAEGSSAQKLARINSVPYLKYCYDMLESITGSLFVFGHSIDENDSHIYDAICRNKRIEKLFFFVHNPVTNLAAVAEKTAKYKTRLDEAEFFYVDAKLAKVWG